MVCACVRACMRACVRACVHACMRACMCVCVCVRGEGGQNFKKGVRQYRGVFVTMLDYLTKLYVTVFYEKK